MVQLFSSAQMWSNVAIIAVLLESVSCAGYAQQHASGLIDPRGKPATFPTSVPQSVPILSGFGESEIPAMAALDQKKLGAVRRNPALEAYLREQQRKGKVTQAAREMLQREKERRESNELKNAWIQRYNQIITERKEQEQAMEEMLASVGGEPIASSWREARGLRTRPSRTAGQRLPTAAAPVRPEEVIAQSKEEIPLTEIEVVQRVEELPREYSAQPLRTLDELKQEAMRKIIERAAREGEEAEQEQQVLQDVLEEITAEEERERKDIAGQRREAVQSSLDELRNALAKILEEAESENIAEQERPKIIAEETAQRGDMALQQMADRWEIQQAFKQALEQKQALQDVLAKVGEEETRERGRIEREEKIESLSALIPVVREYLKRSKK